MKNTNVKVLAEHLSDVGKKSKITFCNDHVVYLVVLNKGQWGSRSYHHSEIVFFVLDGELTIELSKGGEKVQLKEMDMVKVNRMQQFRVKCDNSVSYLAFVRENCAMHREDLPDTYEGNLDVINLLEEANKSDASHRNIELFSVNDHQLRLGVHKGDYPEHHHSNSDECFLFLKGEYHLAHILGEDNLQAYDLVTMNKLEFHKPYMPQKSLLLYFNKKDLRTITYEGSELNYFSD